MSEVEETISRIKSHKSVEGLLITDKEKRIIRTNYTGDKAPEVMTNFNIPPNILITRMGCHENP